jgi:pimeloyl-ACP methyl ester carboxylesterase
VTPVWLHGWPLDEHQWDAEAARFGGVAPRLYGRGAPIDGWAAQILAEVEGDDLALVGSSMGGYTALAMARRAPERVHAIVLAASKAAADTPERQRFRDRLIENLRENGKPPNAAPGATIDDLATAQAAIRDRDDTTDVVRAFAGPVVVCAGTRDELMRPEEAEALAALAHNGRSVAFETGHFINLEDPEGFAAVLETVL